MIKKFYLKLMMSLMLVALAVPQVWAADEFLTVANGSGQSRIAPIFGNWCDTQGTYSVMLYPSSILTEMDGKDITGLKFYPQSSTAFSGTFTVSICETELTYVNANNVNDVVSNLTVVKTGLVLSTGLTSIEIPFDDSYSYGGKNLVVKITLTATGTDANTYFVGETQTSNLVYTNKTNQDSKTFLPKTTFTYSGEEVPYAATVTPLELAFGKFNVGAAASTMNVTLKNKGTSAFTPSVSINDGALNSIFSTTYVGQSIASGETVTIPVTFNPATAGDFTGTMTIDCGLAGTFNINLSGSAVQEITAADGTATDSHLPVYGLYYDEGAQTNQMIYPASMLSGLNGKRITSMTFYTSATSFITDGKVTFSLANLPAETTSFSSAERLTPSDLTQVYSSAPNIAQEWTITFSENANFVYNGGNLLIDVQTESGVYKSMSFYGESGHTNASWWSYRNNTGNTLTDFLPKVTFTYEDSDTPATPVITVDPANVDAFSTEVGTPVTATVNVTGENLTDAIAATISGANADCFTAALENGVLTITYNPTAAGNHTATLTLSSAGAQPVEIALTGTATAPAVPTITVNPATLNINAALGETKTANFTVTGANLEGDITVAASEGFTVSPTTIAAADAAAGATVTVTYVAPTTAETKTGTITLTSEGAEAKTVAINATAADITYDFTVEPKTINFGSILVGETKTADVKITNSGNDAFTPSFEINSEVYTIEAPREVAGGTSQYFTVTYNPTAVGTDNARLTITIVNVTENVQLHGTATELAAYDITSSAASGVHNFGDVFKDGLATWNVTLTNNGANAVTPVIEGLAAPFSAENVPATLAAGESATITFKFAPTAIQAYGPTSIVVKFAETTAFQFDYTFRGSGIEDTGTLPPSAYDTYTYTWTDDNGDEHTSTYSEIATDPNQMIALMKAVYTNKNLPGNYYRGYDANGNPEKTVSYPAIGQVTVDKNYNIEFNDAYGWGMTHDETAYPTIQTVKNSSSNERTFYTMNPNEYKPNQEGVTLLLVEMKDGVGASTITTRPTSYASLKNIFSSMFKSVRVIPNSKKVTKNGVEGTLFKIDCDKMNRFFFLAKGRLRLYDDHQYLTNGLNASSYALANKKIGDGSVSVSSSDKENTVADVNPFNAMYEQFSPVNLNNAQESSDVYQLLINMESYNVEHDCEAIPWASTTGASGTVSGHEFNMYGKASISEDCQDVRDLMFFVPDYRMMYWSGRDKAPNADLTDEYTNYYEQYAPNMGMYVIRQNEITGERNGEAEEYTLHLSWESNLTDFVPAANGQYTIYRVNDDGSYTEVATVPSNQTTYDLTVAMQEHGQQVTYVIQGQDNTRFLSLQFSNEESFIIPGLDENEKFQMMPGAEYYSRFDPQTVQNFYANGMQVMAYPDAATSDYAGQTFNFYRKAAGDADWTLVGTAQVNTAGTEATVSMVEGTQRQQSEYKFGYKQNPTTVAVTTDAKGNKVFGVIFDNFKADVSTNEHPSSYSYKMEVANTSLHSNEMSIKVYKTQMRNLTGTFNEEYVENDEVRQDVDNSRQFDIDVEHSSKTDILRYGAYRWNSSYGTSSNPFAILNLNSTEEEDISPQGQASNQGEFYSVYMNGDSYIGDDVYVAQGETGQATFVDDVPATTNAAEEYTYVPVIETFTGRADYNTYGAPMQTTATGKILVNVENAGKSEYTWEADGNTYRYYNVFVNVNTLDLPEGYEVAKVRAWRKIDASYLNEKLEAYAYRADLDANGEFMFDDPATADDGFKLGGETLGASGPQGGAVYKGTFGALDVENGATVPMKFFVRIYFKKSNGSKAAGDEYYITEVEVDGELNNDVPTSIFGVQSYKVVTGIKYYNMAGVESDVPFNGVNIEVTTYDDGSRSSRKIMK